MSWIEEMVILNVINIILKPNTIYVYLQARIEILFRYTIENNSNNHKGVEVASKEKRNKLFKSSSVHLLWFIEERASPSNFYYPI